MGRLLEVATMGIITRKRDFGREILWRGKEFRKRGRVRRRKNWRLKSCCI